jgi:hypothetical protein
MKVTKGLVRIKSDIYYCSFIFFTFVLWRYTLNPTVHVIAFVNDDVYEISQDEHTNFKPTETVLISAY